MKNKPRHELCIDKTSCKSELENQNQMQDTSSAKTPVYSRQTPMGHGTADVIKKQYIESQQHDIE